MLSTIKDHYFKRCSGGCQGCWETNKFVKGILKEFKDMQLEGKMILQVS